MRIRDPDLLEVCRIVQAARDLTTNAVSEHFEGSQIDPRDPRLLQYIRLTLTGQTESFLCVFLDGKNRYIRDEILARGATGEVRLTPRALFARALELCASGIIIAHNHPSGNCRPSARDLGATNEIAQAGRLLSITLVDHFIISRRGFFSFRAGGLL